MQEIYIEFNLIFDNDYDVSEITQKTGLAASEFRRRRNNKVSPLTNKTIEGFWSLKSIVHNGYDVQVVVDDITARLRPHVEKLNQLRIEHDGEANFCVVSCFDAANLPAIYFERGFLDMVEVFKATIQLDMYIV